MCLKIRFSLHIFSFIWPTISIQSSCERAGATGNSLKESRLRERTATLSNFNLIDLRKDASCYVYWGIIVDDE